MRLLQLIAVGAPLLSLTACGGAAYAPATTPAQPAAVATPARGRLVTPADVQFISGMIPHHAQAVLIAGWAPTHGASPAILRLCERVVVGQRDEIAVMQQWLRDQGEPVPPGEATHDTMPGMDHSAHMPGMLTAEQLTRLNNATGAEFDRLFLTLMIQHHQGAVTMVQQLINSPGAAQDNQVFKLASDIHVDQTTEIARMQGMLLELSLDPVGS
ncbi:MAG: DUF305 domain-containing protein [Gemmatimonadota bacterium]|nr:DUF305 domain-containing protein [Gemmatimonadota bacterium]